MCLSCHSSEEPYYWVPELISVWERLTQSGVFCLRLRIFLS